MDEHLVDGGDDVITKLIPMFDGVHVCHTLLLLVIPQ